MCLLPRFWINLEGSCPFLSQFWFSALVSVSGPAPALSASSGTAYSSAESSFPINVEAHKVIKYSYQTCTDMTILSVVINNLLSSYCMPALFKKLSRAANRTKFLPFWAHVLVSFSTAILDHKYKTLSPTQDYTNKVSKASKTNGQLHNFIKVKELERPESLSFFMLQKFQTFLQNPLDN